ncbi:MAG: hypothetical protein K2Q22_06905 [Cytophagales bacterium]|nr:hypothetical protein [Cytophagales bacterium]
MLKVLRKLYTKFLFTLLKYLKSKLLITSVIIGPKNRVTIGSFVDLQNTILNTNSGNIYIGDHTFFGHNCMVLTGMHDPTLRNRERQQCHFTFGRDIHIGSGVWIASGVTICGNVKIVDNVVIAAGAVVVKDCLEPAIYGGIPAKKIKDLF